ncbi:hypothetical protein AQI95_13555 [Streptomyces yokosukanensis]|uniref:Uncharacterized protein n=1 Tax=Streptomyces yokosukanensis TaxID=67386 RepID=A0A101P6R2_9ACTN|nr:hypothetical protein [Streptomyces yokosukanensis]KUN05960.1 hypothetical protein AQI95_13555 [Streptomyces yokosukanensis]
MLPSTAHGDSRLSLWLRVRTYAVPPSMIERATARRTAGDWAGACAAARIDVDLDLRTVARAHGREIATRLRADLRALAPDLLRWHMPRIAPDGLLRPGLTLTLARYERSDRAGPLHLVARTPPAWADAGQRISLALWDPARPETGRHPHPRPNRRFRLDLHRHLWDARRSGELRARSGADGPVPANHDPLGLAPPDLGCAVGRWAAEAAVLLRTEGRPDTPFSVRLGTRRRLILAVVADEEGTAPDTTDPVRCGTGPDGIGHGCGTEPGGAEPDGAGHRCGTEPSGTGHRGGTGPGGAERRYRAEPTGAERRRGTGPAEAEHRHGAEPAGAVRWFVQEPVCGVAGPGRLRDGGRTCPGAGDGGEPGLRKVAEVPTGGLCAVPVLPDAATWVPPDLELLRAGLLTPDRLHPLVAAALAPGHRTRGPLQDTDPVARARHVECRGARHRIGLVGGVLVPLDHDPQEIRREELLAALGGPPLPCLWVVDEAHRRPHCLAGVRERLNHGDTDGALAVVEGLLGPGAVLRAGPLQDELAAAAERRIAYGLYRAGLTGSGGTSTPRAHRTDRGRRLTRRQSRTATFF